MNTRIANLHKLSRKFVGWITAAGPFIAYILSALTIIGGVTIYAMKIWPDSLFYQIGAACIAVLFALLVERLTLTQSAKVRIAGEKREDIKTHYAKIKDRPTAETEANRERDLAAVKDGAAKVLMVAGALISTCAGTLFWHYLLAALPTWQAWGFSTLFSAIISFTLVSSELHRHLENEVISGAITADHFTDLAANEDMRDRVIKEFGEQHEGALQDVLGHQTVKEIADYTAQRTLDDVLKGQGQIPMHVQREREAQRIRTEAERVRTEQQMEIVHQDDQPKDEKPRGLLSRAIGALKPVEPESANGNGHRNPH